MTDAGGEGRPIDALLAAYAGGTVSRPLDVLIECHLAMQPASREFVAALDAIAGETIETSPPVALRDRQGLLDAVFSADIASTPASTPALADPVLPSPLLKYIGHGFDAVKWRWLLPGLREAKLQDEGVTLLWAKSGTKMPTHTHEGVEVTLVLTGAFRDSTGRYGPGDIEIGDDALDHRPIVEKGMDCVCFVVAEGALRLTGPFGRWIDKLQSL